MIANSSFSQMLLNRRSVRRYAPDPVEKEKQNSIIVSALLSPSSRGLNPWEFIVVENKETIRSLSKSKQHSSAFIAGAPLVIAVIADPARCDVWIEDCSIATILIQLAAESLGLSSCWVQIRERMHSAELSSDAYVKGVLGIPDSYRVEALVSIGYAAETKRPSEVSGLDFLKVHVESFGRKKDD